MRLVIFLIPLFLAPAALAQEDLAAQLDSLKAVIDTQNDMLKDQQKLLDSMARRLAVLERENQVVADPEEDVFVATSADDDPLVDSLADAEQGQLETAVRNTPNDRDEISLQQKEDLKTGKEARILEDSIVLSRNVDLYGSLRIFAQGGDSSPELSDGSSRLGLRLSRDLPDGPTLFGRAEWKVNLVDNNSFFLTNDVAEGGIVTRPTPSSSALTTRLGYLGGRIDDIGEISFGKQWSVYYDVAGWTDNFNVYGGLGLSVFPALTDGGVLGSGRADNAVIFRSSRGGLNYGLQTQLKTTDGGDEYRGLGASFVISPNDDWDLGFAFSAAKVEGDFERITGDDESGVAVLGARYNRGPWNAAVGVAAWKNHEAVFLRDDTLIYDGIGAEVFASYEYSRRLQLYGGINYTNPDIDDPRIDSGFGREFLILGASFFATRESFAYVEALLSTSEDQSGEDIDSLFSIGYRFDY